MHKKRSRHFQWLVLTGGGGGGGGSFLPQGRRGRFSFLFGAPLPIFLAPLCAGEVTIFSGHGSLEPVGDGAHEGTGSSLTCGQGSSHHRFEVPSSGKEVREETCLQGTFWNWRPSVLCLISNLRVI